MSICQRRDGRYLVKFKDNGSWKQKAFRSREEARAFDSEMETDALNSNRLTVLEAVVAYLHNVEHKEQTIQQYKWLIMEGPAADIKDRYCDTLNRRDLEALREACRAKGNSAATINKYTSMICAPLTWCAEQDFLLENPWRKYRKLPFRYKSRRGTLEDFAKVYPLLPAWLQWAARTTIALCLRPGKAELFALKWRAFDWQTGAVSVWMPKVQQGKIVYPPKAYLQDAWERFQGKSTEDYVCPCPHKQFAGSYRNIWKKHCKSVGVTMSMYALRHIAASQMLAAGADIAAVAAQLGHRNVTTTGEYYIHAISGAQRRAGELLPDLVQNSILVQGK